LKIEARAGGPFRELTLVKLWKLFEVRSDRIAHFIVHRLPLRVTAPD